MHGGDLAIRVDVVHDLFHNVSLGATDGGMVRHSLAVDVGRLHYVAVHQHELAHATARERLHTVRAHAAQAQHEHARAGESVEPLLPQDDSQPVGGRLNAFPVACRACLCRNVRVLLAHAIPLDTVAGRSGPLDDVW